MRERIKAIALIITFFLGAALPPILLFLASADHIIIVVEILNLCGWMAAAAFLVRREKTLFHLKEKLSIVDESSNLEAKVGQFLDDLKRYDKAAFAFQLETTVVPAEIGYHLNRILSLALEELTGNAAELTLFLEDNESQIYSQSLLVGFPKSIATQSMLVTDMPEITGPVYDDGKSGQKVLIMPVRFAGTTFGVLRVELPSGRVVKDSDLNVMNLLASQTAVVLLDARFSEELLKMRRLSEESVRAKTGFLANLSHEIRGPLGIILNAVELAQEGLCGEVSEALRETLQMVRESGSHLLDLVNDVLDYAKLEAGKITPKPANLLLKPLLEDIVAVVRSQAVAKKHKLKLERVEATLGIACDKRHARQMLINLLTNAIKYTPEGGTITVKGERAVGNRAKISVIDTGIGIPKSQRHKVFAAFERVEDKYANSQVGTGLGMPLTRKLAEANGGSIDFESEESKGSTFWLILPAVDVTEEKTEEVTGETRVKCGKGETLLLVDPDADARGMLELYLKNQGFEVIGAGEGRDVLRILRDQKVELAIVENDLQELSGEEIIAAIRSNPKLAALPVVLISAKAFVFDIERFLKLGVDRCLSKPVPLHELAQTARRLIDESASQPTSPIAPI